MVRTFTVAMALITFAVSLGLIFGFNSDSAGLQFENNFIWIASPRSTTTWESTASVSG